MRRNLNVVIIGPSWVEYQKYRYIFKRRDEERITNRSTRAIFRSVIDNRFFSFFGLLTVRKSIFDETGSRTIDERIRCFVPNGRDTDNALSAFPSMSRRSLQIFQCIVLSAGNKVNGRQSSHNNLPTRLFWFRVQRSLHHQCVTRRDVCIREAANS